MRHSESCARVGVAWRAGWGRLARGLPGRLARGLPGRLPGSPGGVAWRAGCQAACRDRRRGSPGARVARPPAGIAGRGRLARGLPGRLPGSPDGVAADAIVTRRSPLCLIRVTCSPIRSTPESGVMRNAQQQSFALIPTGLSAGRSEAPEWRDPRGSSRRRARSRRRQCRRRRFASATRDRSTPQPASARCTGSGRG